jgi:membrane-associated phospholipid phosphatase
MDSNMTTMFYNELAAVPSLHVGFAVAVGIAVAAAVRNPVLKALALLWGPTIGLAVVATGNHFIFDIAAGIVASAVGYGVGRLAARGRASTGGVPTPATAAPVRGTLRPAFAKA